MRRVIRRDCVCPRRSATGDRYAGAASRVLNGALIRASGFALSFPATKAAGEGGRAAVNRCRTCDSFLFGCSGFTILRTFLERDVRKTTAPDAEIRVSEFLRDALAKRPTSVRFKRRSSSPSKRRFRAQKGALSRGNRARARENEERRRWISNERRNWFSSFDQR